MRKIRVTLGSDLHNDIGANINLYFGDIELESNLAVDQTGMVREYTVDVENGTYDLRFVFLNDEADDFDNNGTLEEDRNFIIENLEIANDGETFVQFALANTVLNNIHAASTVGTPEDPGAQVWSYPLRMWVGEIDKVGVIPITFS